MKTFIVVRIGGEYIKIKGDSIVHSEKSPNIEIIKDGQKIAIIPEGIIVHEEQI